jgi:hypothetical protein
VKNQIIRAMSNKRFYNRPGCSSLFFKSCGSSKVINFLK